MIGGYIHPHWEDTRIHRPPPLPHIDSMTEVFREGCGAREGRVPQRFSGGERVGKASEESIKIIVLVV